MKPHRCDSLKPMSREPTAETIAVWKRLNRASRTVQGAIDGDLKKAGLPPLDWYEVLVEIKLAGKTGARPFEMADELGIAQYQLSRLLGRMENAGLIRRKTVSGDARGQVIQMTSAGRKTHGDIWSVAASALQRSIGERLEITEALRLGQFLQRLAPQQ